MAKSWQTNVLGLLARYLYDLYPDKKLAWFEERLTLLAKQLSVIIGSRGFGPIQVTVDVILEQVFMVEYDLERACLHLDPQAAFAVIRYALAQSVAEAVEPGAEELSRKLQGQSEMIAACLLDAYSRPLRWKDLTRDERVLAEAVADQFLWLEAEQAIEIVALRGKCSRTPDEPLEPRLRIFMNTLVRNGGELPGWFKTQPPGGVPEVSPFTPSGEGFDA